MSSSFLSRLRPRLSKAWIESRDLIWARRRRLAVGFLLLLVGRVCGLILPATTKYLVDEVIGEGRLGILGWLLLAAGLGTVIQAASSFGLSQLLGVAAQRSIAELRQSVEQHVVRLPVSFFDSKKSGELISRIMNDADGIRNLVGTGLVYLVGSVVTATLALAVLLYLQWRLTLVTLAVLLGFLVFMGFSIVKLRPIFRERSKIEAEVTGRLNEALGGIRIVKSYTSEKREDRIFAAGTHRLFRATRRAIVASSAMGAVTSLSFGLLAILMMWIGARSIVSGEMTLGDFVMYLAFTGFLVAPMVQAASITAQMSEAFAGLDRIRELRSLTSEAQADEGRSRLDSVDGAIDFENVSFSYREGSPVLRNISFSVPVGTTTALVGPSGAGKSTIFRLAMAFGDPDEGRVLIDGHDLRDIRRSDYRSHLGVVLQEDFLFDGTIFENIRYSRPRATLSEVEAVSRLAHCDEFVDQLEDRYDTIIGERGIRLSGGQRQRVAIARAILADPRILLLDEATSSLDTASEAFIQDGLRVLRRGRTTLVIAHRLSTIRTADQILVMDEGRLIERGTHEDLLQAGGRYQELWQLQSGLPRLTESPAPPQPQPQPEPEPEPEPGG